MEPARHNRITSPEDLAATENAAAAPSRLSAAIFAFLVVACIAAFFVTQRLKHTPTLVQAFKMTPAFTPSLDVTSVCHRPLERSEVLRNHHLEYISFRTSSSMRIVVSVTSEGKDVATLAHDVTTKRYRRLSLCWNGHIGVHQTGALAPPGHYGIVVTMRGTDRRIPAPRDFALLGASE